MKKVLLLFNLLIAVTFGDTLRIATPDYSMDSNTFKTPYLELVDSVYRSEGVTVLYFFVPWARARDMVEKGEADAMLFVFYSDSEESLIYPLYPMGEEKVVALFKKHTPQEWEGEKSLCNKRVVYVRGYDYAAFIGTPFTVVEVSSNIQGWKMVESGRVDFFLDDSKEVSMIIREKRMDSSLFRIEPILTNNYYLGFCNTHKNKAFAGIWDRRVPILLKSGSVKTIFDRYAEPTPLFIRRNE